MIQRAQYAIVQERQRRSLYDRGLTDAEIARAVHRSYNVIWLWRERRKLPRLAGRKIRLWNEQEIMTLRSLYRSSSAGVCALALGRSRASIECKLRRICADRKKRPNSTLGMPAAQSKWSPREVQVLSKYYRELEIIALSERLGRTPEAICKKAQLLGIRKRPPASRWSYSDVVRVLESNVPPAQLKLSLRRSDDAVYSMKRLLTIKISEGVIDTFLALLPGAPASIAYRKKQWLPPGLRRGWSRLTRTAKDTRAREYLAREAERERQKAARDRWRANRPK